MHLKLNPLYDCMLSPCVKWCYLVYVCCYIQVYITMILSTIFTEVLIIQSNKTCPLVEQYLDYILIIKNRSENTILEYRTDLFMFFSYIMKLRNMNIVDINFEPVNLEFIKSITLQDMYSFIFYCQKSLNASAGTRARKIVSIRQFSKYLKAKAYIIDNNIAATLIYKYSKVDIRILGHESVATTEIYTHIDKHQLQYGVSSKPLALMFN